MTEHTCFPGAEYQCDERNGSSNLFLGFCIFGWVGRRLYHLRREIRLKILVVADFFSFLDKTIDGSSTTWS